MLKPFFDDAASDDHSGKEQVRCAALWCAVEGYSVLCFCSNCHSAHHEDSCLNNQCAALPVFPHVCLLFVCVHSCLALLYAAKLYGHVTHAQFK